MLAIVAAFVSGDEKRAAAGCVRVPDRGVLQRKSPPDSLASGKTSGATYAEGDADGDGDIDLNDYGAHKGNFGVNWTSW